MASASLAQRQARVLIVSAYAEPHLGGVEVVVAEQSCTLAALGCSVTVVTSRCDARAAKHEQVDGYEIVRVPAWNKLEELKGIPFPIWSPSAIWRLARMIRNTDIVHVHDVYHGSSILAAGLASWLRGPPLITPHAAAVGHSDPALKRRLHPCHLSAA